MLNISPLIIFIFVFSFCATLRDSNAAQDNHYAIHGFSNDGSVFIFEEFGSNEYIDNCGDSSIYFIDLKKDKWVAGTPIVHSVCEESELETETGTPRETAQKKALNLLKKYSPFKPLEIMFKNENVTFAEPVLDISLLDFRDFWQRENLSVKVTPLPLSPSPEYNNHFEKDCFGFSVMVNGRELYRDEKIPLTRGCPLSYSIDAIVTGGIRSVMLLTYFTYDMEGDHDRNYLAVPLSYKLLHWKKALEICMRSDFENAVFSVENCTTAINSAKLSSSDLAIAYQIRGTTYKSLQKYEQGYLTALKWDTLVDAQRNLGSMYANGQGVPKDDKEAVKWYTLAAEQGDADVQFILGSMYANGQGVPKDDKEAVKWFTHAGEQGNFDAQFNLGQMYAEGRGVPQDYRIAMKWLMPIAEYGHADAQYNLGEMYRNGQGVTQNYAEAANWYRRAAEQGDARAQHNLGVMYANGQGVSQDYIEAMNWYRKAAEQGFVDAQHNLGVIYANGQGVTQDYAEAVKWFRKAAEQGYAAAQFNLGVMYDKGQSVRQDYALAVNWYRKAAEQGYAAAQTNLGNKYANGEGFTQDYKEAVNWFRKAAEQGYAAAQYNLGWMYDKGQGVTQDYAEAANWYRKAAEQGHADAQHNLGWMYDKGQGVRQDYALAVNWYHKAAEQGIAAVQFNLGLMYAKGQGVLQNFVYAHMWWNIAASSGNELAVSNRDMVAEKMTASQIAEATALARECVQKNYKGC